MSGGLVQSELAQHSLPSTQVEPQQVWPELAQQVPSHASPEVQGAGHWPPVQAVPQLLTQPAVQLPSGVQHWPPVHVSPQLSTQPALQLPLETQPVDELEDVEMWVDVETPVDVALALALDELAVWEVEPVDVPTLDVVCMEDEEDFDVELLPLEDDAMQLPPVHVFPQLSLHASLQEPLGLHCEVHALSSQIPLAQSAASPQALPSAQLGEQVGWPQVPAVQTPDAQLAPVLHVCPSGHDVVQVPEAHSPPVQIPDSQLAASPQGAPVGHDGEHEGAAHVPRVQTPEAQSVGAPQTMPVMQGAHGGEAQTPLAQTNDAHSDELPHPVPS